MTITDVLWNLSFIGSVIALFVWAYKIKRAGYRALIVRSERLRQQGINDIFLLFSSQDRGVFGGSPWEALVGGYLAYLQGGHFVIEAVFSDEIRTIGPWDASMQVRLTKRAGRLWHEAPGLYLGDADYAIVGRNVTDEAAARKLLRLKGKNQLLACRTELLDRLGAEGFNVPQA